VIAQVKRQALRFVWSLENACPSQLRGFGKTSEISGGYVRRGVARSLRSIERRGNQVDLVPDPPPPSARACISPRAEPVPMRKTGQYFVDADGPVPHDRSLTAHDPRADRLCDRIAVNRDLASEPGGRNSLANIREASRFRPAG